MALSPNSIITPQVPLTPVGQTIATANTAKDGTGTVVTVFTAGADGARCDAVQVAYTGTSVATCMRFFVNNGLTNATAGNNSLFKSVTVTANTLSEVAGALDFSVLIGLTLPAGYKINVTIGTTVAAALALTGSGGNL